MEKVTFSERTQELLDTINSKPLGVGDLVTYKGGDGYGVIGTISGIIGDAVRVEPRGKKSSVTRPISEIERYTLEVGVNPIQKRSIINKYNTNITRLLAMVGYDDAGNVTSYSLMDSVLKVPTCSLSPVVYIDGSYYEYQRDFVWDLEDKQKLIRSIYNGIPIGSLIFRTKSYSKVKFDQENNSPSNSWYDLIDGKQRVSTILEFIRSEFPDHNGYYFNDLSIRARNQFFTYSDFLSIELDEDITDKEVLEYFILLNDTGVPLPSDILEKNKDLLNKM